MKNENGAIIISTLILFIPYALFNLGVVFETAKIEPVSFIDVPYSIALSGHRIDVSTVYDDEDIEAVEWLNQYTDKNGIGGIIYSDENGSKLIYQIMGFDRTIYKTFRDIEQESAGYIYLRKRNMDTGEIVFTGDYACRIYSKIEDMEVIDGLIDKGEVVFDNGARIIRIGE